MAEPGISKQENSKPKRQKYYLLKLHFPPLFEFPALQLLLKSKRREFQNYFAFDYGLCYTISFFQVINFLKPKIEKLM